MSALLLPVGPCVPGVNSEAVMRPAVTSDVVAIRQCATAAYSKYLKRIGKPPAPMAADFEALVRSGRVVVATRGDQLAGFVVYYQVQHVMHLENVAVFPSLSGKGTGRSLIKHVEDKAAELGLEYVELYTNEAMTENLLMYPALGYEEYERRCEEGFNRVYFRIRIT